MVKQPSSYHITLFIFLAFVLRVFKDCTLKGFIHRLFQAENAYHLRGWDILTVLLSAIICKYCLHGKTCHLMTPINGVHVFCW